MSNTLKDNALNWLLTGTVGISSKAMLGASLGITPAKESNFGNHPHDPDDLSRCLALLKAVPEVRSHFDQIAKLSPQWEALIAHWDELESIFVEEAGYDWSKSTIARKTFTRMREILAAS